MRTTELVERHEIETLLPAYLLHSDICKYMHATIYTQSSPGSLLRCWDENALIPGTSPRLNAPHAEAKVGVEVWGWMGLEEGGRRMCFGALCSARSKPSGTF